MTERNICIVMNSFESGVLLGILLDHPRTKLIENVQTQLITIKKQIEKEAGVVKKKLPNGKLRITDKDGNVITRDPYSWEV